MTLERRQMLTIVGQMVDSGLIAVTKFREDLDKDPAKAFEWSSNAVYGAAIVEQLTPWRDALRAPDWRLHVLYEGFDIDAPDAIKDRNGEVVLEQCRFCNRAESELDAHPQCDKATPIDEADLIYEFLTEVIRQVLRRSERTHVSVSSHHRIMDRARLKVWSTLANRLRSQIIRTELHMKF